MYNVYHLYCECVLLACIIFLCIACFVDVTFTPGFTPVIHWNLVSVIIKTTTYQI